LAQEKIKSKPESSPEFSIYRRTEFCHQIMFIIFSRKIQKMKSGFQDKKLHKKGDISDSKVADQA